MFYFSELDLKFFRGFTALHLELTNDCVLLYGDNGSGKTNVLEALCVLCLTKSFKPVSDKELTHWDYPFYYLTAQILHHPTLHTVSCNYLKNKGKKLFHNEQPISKFSEHIGLLPCVSLIPEDSEIIYDSAKRRRWFNLLFSQWDNEYLTALQKYEHALQQRNILLKSEKPFKELEPWTYQLCQQGKILTTKRKNYLEELSKMYSQIYSEIGDWEVNNFLYVPNYAYQTLEQDLRYYESQLKNDYGYGFTTIGAHRDDVLFQIHHQTLKSFGSQGQQKTFLITLKLTEYEFLSQKPIQPILLLDDVFEKLDAHRIQAIANYLFHHKKGQIFITHPSRLNLEFPFLAFHLKNHRLVS